MSETNKKSCLPKIIFAALLAIGGFHADVYSPIAQKISNFRNPSQIWECEQDKNVRGIVLTKLPQYSEDIFFNYGKKVPVTVLDKVSETYHKNKEKGLISYSKMCIGRSETEDKSNCLIEVKVTGEEEILLSSMVYDEFGKLICKIEENEFLLNTDCILTYNLDKNGFEVIDDEDDVIFNLDYKNNEIIFNGVLLGNNKINIFLGDEGVDKWRSLIGLDNATKRKMVEEGLSKRKKIKKIFVYTGKDWFGKRAKT